VAKAVEVGHQLYLALARIGIQGQDVFTGQRIRSQPNERMVGKVKGMLGVELQYVHLEQGKAIHNRLERFEGGNLAARDIQHDAPIGQHWPVVDLAGWPRRALQARDLSEGLHRIVEGCRTVPTGQDGFRGNRNGKSLRAVLLSLSGGEWLAEIRTGGRQVVAQEDHILQARRRGGFDDR